MKLTEVKIEDLGFLLIKSYHHDEFYTRRFEKGVIQIEFTYEAETDRLETIDVIVDEVVSDKLTNSDILDLDRILNK